MIVAVRASRFAPYVAHSNHDHYGQARLEQLTQKGRFYDAQIFRSEPFTPETLVYAPPQAVHLVNPYDRLVDLFDDLVTAGSYRCLVARPSPSAKLDAHRAYIYSYYRRLNHIDSIVHAVTLQRNGDYIQTYRISYRAQNDPPYEFVEEAPRVRPVRAGRMEGIYIADVAFQYELYFGYVENPSEDAQYIVDQVKADAQALYDL